MTASSPIISPNGNDESLNLSSQLSFAGRLKKSRQKDVDSKDVGHLCDKLWRKVPVHPERHVHAAPYLLDAELLGIIMLSGDPFRQLLTPVVCQKWNIDAILFSYSSIDFPNVSIGRTRDSLATIWVPTHSPSGLDHRF
jgi:hypothetical protein